VCYAALAAVALVQLVRIERRVPEYGWTTQKVFHLLNLLVCSLRAAVMTFRVQLQVRLLRCCVEGLRGLVPDRPKSAAVRLSINGACTDS
jgi:Protein of unknown function (DUF1084)